MVFGRKILETSSALPPPQQQTHECMFDFDIPRLVHSKKTRSSNAFKKGKSIVMVHEGINVSHLIY